MKLNHVTLKNFRQYHGEQTIYFSTDNDRHVTVIQGVNGAGKTSLCIALNWCLYGDALVEERFGDIGELVSKHDVVGTDTSVKVNFTYQGTQYWAERKYSLPSNTQAVFLLKKEGDTHPHRDRDALDMVQSIIPEDVSDHFFFDGEKIDNFAKPGHENDVKSAVDNVLKVEVLQRSITHLKKVAQEYNRDLKQELAKHPESGLEALLKERETQQMKRTEMSSARSEKQREVVAAKEQIRDIDKRLESIEESRQLAEERRKIEEELEGFTKAKLEEQEKIREFANYGFLPIAKPVLDKALKILDKNETSNVSQLLLEELLERAICLCGRPIHSESQEHQNLISLLNESKIMSPKSDTVVRDTYSDLKSLLQYRIGTIPMELKSALSRNQQLERSTAASEARLQEIGKQLVDFDQNEVRDLQKSRAQYERDIGRLGAEIKELEHQIEKSQGESADLKGKIRSARTAKNEVKQLTRYGELAGEALEAMEKIREPFAEDIREKLQTKVQEIFKQLVWKDSYFQEVRLSEKFELQVIDRFGGQARPEMSAGERQVLSLAFIVAMAKIASEDMPLGMADEPFAIVMDTPFGRLATKPRENITATVPEIAKQLILFVTDEELHGQARANLEPRIGAEYELRFDDESGVTEIVKIQ